MSCGLNLRYPEGVRCGSMSPSDSRKRILEMVTSGNSSRSVLSTVPILTGRLSAAAVPFPAPPLAD